MARGEGASPACDFGSCVPKRQGTDFRGSSPVLPKSVTAGPTKTGYAMARRGNSFGAHLRHFAKSVDIVDENVFNQVRHLVFKYVKDELRAEYFELSLERIVDGERGLQMFWSSRDERGHTWRLQKEDGVYNNPVTQAVAEARPLWLVGSDRSSLLEADSYVDLWSKVTGLPRYQQSADQPVHTVVIVPLKHKRVLGAYFFETYEYLGGITDEAKT